MLKIYVPASGFDYAKLDELRKQYIYRAYKLFHKAEPVGYFDLHISSSYNRLEDLILNKAIVILKTHYYNLKPPSEYPDFGYKETARYFAEWTQVEDPDGAGTPMGIGKISVMSRKLMQEAMIRYHEILTGEYE